MPVLHQYDLSARANKRTHVSDPWTDVGIGQLVSRPARARCLVNLFWLKQKFRRREEYYGRLSGKNNAMGAVVAVCTEDEERAVSATACTSTMARDGGLTLDV